MLKRLANQSGYSAILFVMMLLSISGGLFAGFHQHMMTINRIYAEKVHYTKAYNLAYSSLMWGIGQDWRHTNDLWQCLQQRSLSLNVCAKRGGEEDIVIVRGEGIERNVNIILYALLRLSDSKYHRLDYCPVSSEVLCE